MENLFKDFYGLTTFTRQKSKLIICIGAGGTGSAFIRDAARMMAVDQENGGQTKMIICDADVVEESNLKRQCFSPRDIGRNKAGVLAQRYSSSFGVDIGYVDTFIESPDALNDLIVNNWVNNSAVYLFTFVDNVKTRIMVHNFVHTYVRANRTYRRLMWIDSGNTEFAGQVVAFSSQAIHVDGPSLQGVDTTNYCPDVCEIKRDLLDPANWDKFASELSCEESAIHHPQTMAANTTAANLCLNMFFDVMFGSGRLDYNMVTFAANKNVFRTTRLENRDTALVGLVDLNQQPKKEEVTLNE